MTQDHSTKLSFSIEESVWLNKGQQVDEIVSLSLDPEITVQEHGDYVLIRGGLKLTGEYRSNGNSIASEGDKESLSSQVAFRSIEEVTLNEDGTGEIRHHFPIDVTIPQERIKSLDDIYVIVDSFDYDIPERGCIQLTADVSITGMSTQKVNKEADRFKTDEGEERTFHFEAYNEEHTEEDETVVQFPTIEDSNQFEVEEKEKQEEEERSEEVEVELEISEEVAEEVEEVDDANEVELVSDEVEEVSEVKETQSPAIAFGVVKNRPKNKPSETESDESLQTKKETFSVAKSFSNQRKSELEQQQKYSRNEIEATEAEEIADEDKPPREENALYLTKMLTKGEEEQFKKLKLCIIRENETIETIAARYEINQSTLIRVNHLNDTKLEEGQILYIPVTQ